MLWRFANAPPDLFGRACTPVTSAVTDEIENAPHTPRAHNSEFPSITLALSPHSHRRSSRASRQIQASPADRHLSPASSPRGENSRFPPSLSLSLLSSRIAGQPEPCLLSRRRPIVLSRRRLLLTVSASSPLPLPSLTLTLSPLASPANRSLSPASSPHNLCLSLAAPPNLLRLFSPAGRSDKLAAPVKDAVSWNLMIDGFVQIGDLDSALKYFQRLSSPSIVSWVTVLTAYARNGQINQARELFDRMPERNVVAWNAMITGYVQTGDVGEGYKLFNEMPERNSISWTTMINGYVRVGKLDKARELLDSMPYKNVAAQTAMISGYAQNMRMHDARQIFDKIGHRDSVLKYHDCRICPVWKNG